MHFGGTRGILLVAVIDLVVGPLLTFVVFDLRKQSLKFDLLIIAFIQITALGYGLWSINTGRPTLQVLVMDQVHVLTQPDLDAYGIQASSLPYQGRLPHRVYVDAPKVGFMEYKILSELNVAPLQFRTDLYKEFPMKIDSPLQKRLSCIEVSVVGRSDTKNGCLNPKDGVLVKSEDAFRL